MLFSFPGQSPTFIFVAASHSSTGTMLLRRLSFLHPPNSNPPQTFPRITPPTLASHQIRSSGLCNTLTITKQAHVEGRQRNDQIVIRSLQMLRGTYRSFGNGKAAAQVGPRGHVALKVFLLTTKKSAFIPRRNQNSMLTY